MGWLRTATPSCTITQDHARWPFGTGMARWKSKRGLLSRSIEVIDAEERAVFGTIDDRILPALSGG